MNQLNDLKYKLLNLLWCSAAIQWDKISSLICHFHIYHYDILYFHLAPDTALLTPGNVFRV